jgi:hypothetical protein
MPVHIAGLELNDGRVTSDGNLTVAVASAKWDIGGQHGSYLGSEGNSVTDDDTSYVYLDEFGVLQIETAGWPTIAHARLATVTAAGGVITNIVDERAWINGTGMGAYPNPETVTERWIYVRTTGSDTTGDGKTVGTAYRTVRHAAKQIAYTIRGMRFIIDCTDLGQELNTEPLVFPMSNSCDPTYYDSSPAVPGFNVRAPITLQATPTLIDTISGVELSGQTTDSVTGLRTLQTTKNYTLNQHRGKFVRDTNGVMGVIASNTAGPNSELEITQNDAFTAPIEILEQSCEIRNSDSGGGNAVDFRHVSAHVQLNGIKLTTANTSTFRYGLYGDSAYAAVGMQSCYVDGLFISLGGAQHSFSDTYFTKRFGLSGCAANLWNCFVYDAVVALRNSGTQTDINFWYENIFDECGSVGGGTGIEDQNRVSISMDRCEIRNGTSDGLYVGPGSMMRFRRGNAKDNAGEGIWADGALRFVLLDVGGTGNTYHGVKLTSGAHVVKQGTVSVTGSSGDYKVGGNSVGTWAGFSGDENDLGAGTPQLCRMST